MLFLIILRNIVFYIFMTTITIYRYLGIIMRLTVYKKTVYFFLLSFLLFSFSSYGSSTPAVENDTQQYIDNEKSNDGIFNPVEYLSFKGYKGDGSFVEAPAHVGDWTGYIIGVLPAILITEPFRLLSIGSNEGNSIGVNILYGTTKTFGCLFGGPSYILQGLFWDIPIWIFGGESGSQPSINNETKTSIPVAKKQKKENESIYHYKWEPKQIKPPVITSITAKPSMLRNVEVSAKKPVTEKVAKKQKEPTPIMASQVIDNQIPIKDKITKEDETSWSSPPPLPDWVKKEMDNE